LGQQSVGNGTSGGGKIKPPEFRQVSFGFAEEQQIDMEHRRYWTGSWGMLHVSYDRNGYSLTERGFKNKEILCFGSCLTPDGVKSYRIIVGGFCILWGHL
jgi:hypothetical protein